MCNRNVYIFIIQMYKIIENRVHKMSISLVKKFKFHKKNFLLSFNEIIETPIKSHILVCV